MSVPGRVVRVRLSPADCMRVVDSLKVMGVENKRGELSFSQAVKMVLESCLVALERDKIIPERDGFEFLDMMKGFPDRQEAIKARGQQIKYTKDRFSEGYKAQPIVQDVQHARRKSRFDELFFKANNDMKNMTQGEIDEYLKLQEDFG
jgi:hypothetical protein